MKKKSYFPMFVDLSDKNVVIVGGGNIATRRVKTMLQFTRNVKVIAPKMTEELLELGRTSYAEVIVRPVKRSDFSFAYMVIAATNDRKLNDEIYRVCKEEGIYVNIADDREKCDFQFPGIFKQEDLVVGLMTNGLDTKTARKVHVAIEEALTETDFTGEE